MRRSGAAGAAVTSTSAGGEGAGRGGRRRPARRAESAASSAGWLRARGFRERPKSVEDLPVRSLQPPQHSAHGRPQDGESRQGRGSGAAPAPPLLQPARSSGLLWNSASARAAVRMSRSD